MGALDRVITLNITLATKTASAAGFGIPLVLAYDAPFAERHRLYGDLPTMVTDGFLSTDWTYKAVAQMLAQAIRPPLIAVGRAANMPTKTVDVTPTAVNDTTYTITITDADGVTDTANFVADSDATVLEITAGLFAAINALATAVTATDNTTKVTIAADVVGELFDIQVDDTDTGKLLDVEDVTTDPGIVADVNAIDAAYPDWYALCLLTTGALEALAVAPTVAAMEKIAGMVSLDSGVRKSAVSDDIASTLQAATQDRFHVAARHRMDDFEWCSHAARALPEDPGSITWFAQTLAGVEKSPVRFFGTTEVATCHSKNAGTYLDLGGLGVTEQGKFAGGQFIDIIRGRDWFKARVQERWITLLVERKKVGMTDPGAAEVESILRAQIGEGQTAGYIARDPEPVVFVPKIADVPSADRAARNLPDNEFEFRLQGAIHHADVAGTITA